MLLAVVFTFFVQNKSFTAIGTPGSFLLKSGLESNSVAFFKAVSKVSSLYVFKLLDFLDLSTYADVTSFDEIFLFFILKLILIN